MTEKYTLLMLYGGDNRIDFIVGRIDPVEYVGVSQQRNGNVRNINHPLCDMIPSGLTI